MAWVESELHNLPATKWRKCQYYIEDGLIKPIPGSKVTEYDPFLFYKPPGIDEDQTEQPVWLALAELNIDSDDEILSFINRFGPLGIVNWKTKAWVLGKKRHPDQEGIPVYAVQGLSLVSVEKIIEKYQPVHLNEWHQKNKHAVQGLQNLPHLLSEPISELKEVILDYQKAVELFRAFQNGKDDFIKTYLDLYPDEIRISVPGEEMDLFFDAVCKLTYVVNMVGTKNKVTPRLDLNRKNKFTWRWSYDCLISVIYLMLSMVISGNWYIRRCANENCKQLFSTDVHNKIHCSEKCGWAHRKRKSRKKEAK